MRRYLHINCLRFPRKCYETIWQVSFFLTKKAGFLSFLLITFLIRDVIIQLNATKQLELVYDIARGVAGKCPAEMQEVRVPSLCRYVADVL